MNARAPASSQQERLVHIYRVRAGVWEFPDGTSVSGLYSGDDEMRYRNNPASEGVRAKGPIPRGLWRIGPARTSPNVGPITMNLDPEEGTHTYGRSAFRIHGDSRKHPGDASSGCIVANRDIRSRIARHPVRLVRVVAD